MGKGPKHNLAKPRSNGIFKVAGMNFKKESKGKPKEVTSNIKLVHFAVIETGLIKMFSLDFS
jgi:hypothetical protein